MPEVKKLILEGFAEIKDMGEKDLKEAKERVIGLMRVESEDSSRVMHELLFSELSGKAEDYYEFEKKINKVELGEVKKLASELIKGYSTAAVLPK